jgi:catalase
MMPVRRILLCAALLLAAGLARAEEKPFGERMADVMQAGNGGPHAGFRLAHAKGALFEGEFTATPEARGLTRAAHMQGTTLPVVIRFSSASGIPTLPDAAPQNAVRGIGMTFKLPDGSGTDLLGISVNAFPVSNGEDFLKLNQAAQASARGEPQPMRDFVAAHPAVARFGGIPKPMPQSFATEAYFSINAFRFINAAGESHFIRYRIVPEAGTAFLTPEQAASAPPDLLETEMRERIGRGPAAFRLQAQLAEPGDPTGDATAVWPEERRPVELGRLVVMRAVANSDEVQRTMGFLPTNVTDGIEVSDDPLLQARSETYAVSFERRTQ